MLLPSINIADDGHGFDPAQVNSKTSPTGLRGLRDRVSAVGADTEHPLRARARHDADGRVPTQP